MVEAMHVDEAPVASSISPDDLLCAPKDKILDDKDHRMTRLEAEYECHDGRFSLDKKMYGQYFQLYFQRLMVTMPKLRSEVEARWKGTPICKVLDLEEGKQCVLMGTLYKNMKLKPCILDEYTKERGLGSEVSSNKFVSDDDSVVLEDEGARVKLIGKPIDPHKLVTGVVMAARGCTTPDGNFDVVDVCFPSAGPQPSIQKHAAEGKYVALVSGLSTGASDISPLRAQLLVDYLTGHLGGAAEQQVAARVVRVVLAGEALAPKEPPAGSVDPKQHAEISRPLKELDMLLTQLAAAMPVDLMPGDGDPTNHALPQQPLHPCLFPETARYEATFRATTNPHDFSVDGARVLGTSGQNVADLLKYTDMRRAGTNAGADGDEGNGSSSPEDELDTLEATLRWQHIAPSAPDTLACYPFKDRDPFVMDVCPHVYFAGNCAEYGSRVVTLPSGQKTLLVAVPRFSKTGVAVLVNINTLECHPITFSDDALSA